MGKDELLDDGDEKDADEESRPSYLFMEMHSTSKVIKGGVTPKKEIDVEKMVQQFSMEDFMKGLYVTHQHSGPSKATVQDKNQLIMAALMSGKGLGDLQKTMDDVSGSQQEATEAGEEEDDSLRNLALQNLRDKRQQEK